MLKLNGGAARGLSNDDITMLYGLEFDDGDLEIMEAYHPYLTKYEVLELYGDLARQLYNVNIDDIEGLAANNSNTLPNSNVTKRDVAREVVHFLVERRTDIGGSRRKNRRMRKKSTRRTRRTRRMSRTRRQRKT